MAVDGAKVPKRSGQRYPRGELRRASLLRSEALTYDAEEGVVEHVSNWMVSATCKIDRDWNRKTRTEAA
jgi:hypothetical protein